MLEFNTYNGLLFVGDPHLWSKGPGKRLDEKIFSSVVLNKIEQAVDIALKNNLYLVFLGDLFHVKEENDIGMLTKLSRILKKMPEPCVTVEGNHEKKELKLTDDVALSLLREAGVIYTIEKSALWAKFNFLDGTSAYVGSTPHGEKIPMEVSLPKNEKNVDTPIIWLTHHDLDFGETYPGAVAIKEIKGVSMLVNGHIHKTKKSLKFGQMLAHNPGNITRLSTDCKDHVPSVWQWKPDQEFNLEPIDLIFEKHVFNLVGKQIEIDVKPVDIVEEITPQQAIRFVEKMKEESQKYDPNKTSDGAYLKDNISVLAKSMNLDQDFLKEILAITDETLESIK